jgi:E3 ubiquitin-protein ligase TRIP12
MLARYTKAKDKMQRQIDKGITPDLTLEEMVQAARASAAASMPSSTAPTPQVGTPPIEFGATTSQPQSLGMSGLNQAMEKRGKEAEAAALKRQEVLQENAGVVNTFSKILIPVIVDVYNASAALKVRSRILNALLRSITFCETKELQETLKVR